MPSLSVFQCDGRDTPGSVNESINPAFMYGGQFIDLPNSKRTIEPVKRLNRRPIGLIRAALVAVIGSLAICQACRGQEFTALPPINAEMLSAMVMVWPNGAPGIPVPLVTGNPNLLDVRIWLVNPKRCAPNNFDEACKSDLVLVTVGDGVNAPRGYASALAYGWKVESLDFRSGHDPCVLIVLKERVVEIMAGQIKQWGERPHAVCLTSSTAGQQ